MPPTPPTPFDSIGGLDLFATLDVAVGGNSMRTFIAGGGLLGIIFIFDIAVQLYRVNKGEPPDYMGAIWRLIGFTLLLGFYVKFAGALLDLIGQYGTMKTADRSILAQRGNVYAKFMTVNAIEQASGNWLVDGPLALLETFFEALVWLSYAFAAGVVYGLTLIQRAAISFLITIGPLFITLAAIPWRPARSLLVAWIMAIIEVAIWGVAATSLASLLDRNLAYVTVGATTTSPNLAQHFTFNVMYAFAFLSVPLIVKSVMGGASPGGAMTSIATMVTAGGAAMANGADAARGAVSGTSSAAKTAANTAATAARTGAGAAGAVGGATAAASRRIGGQVSPNLPPVKPFGEAASGGPAPASGNANTRAARPSKKRPGDS